MDIEFLKYLNNGYDPRLLYGTGALGYRPARSIMGEGIKEDLLEFPELAKEFTPDQLADMQLEDDKAEEAKRYAEEVINEADDIVLKYQKGLSNRAPPKKVTVNVKTKKPKVKNYLKKRTMKTKAVVYVDPEISKARREEAKEQKRILKEQKKEEIKIFKYTKNLMKEITKVKVVLKDYETKNPDGVVFTEYDNYPKKIQKIIDKIEEVRYDFFTSDEISKEEFVKQKDISLELFDDSYVFDKGNPYFQKALPYLKSITVNETQKFLDDDAALKAFFPAGKPAEFGICGLDNKVAKKIYNLKHPNFEITDYLIEDAGSKLGGQFPIDDIDRTNLIFNEMKYYTDITLKTIHSYQIRLKKQYYNQLLETLKEDFRLYEIAFLKGETSSVKDVMLNITSVLDVLTDKDEFNKDFYKNSESGYFGIGVTMNKFNPIEIPEGYDFTDSPSTEKQIAEVKSNQKQKFIPNIKNRKVIGMLTKAGQSNAVDEKIKNMFFKKGQKYDYKITCVMGDCIGVYDYTKDDYVENDFILGTYRTGYTHDAHDGRKYNAVLIPIEKFILPKISKESSKKKKQSTEI